MKIVLKIAFFQDAIGTIDKEQGPEKHYGYLIPMYPIILDKIFTANLIGYRLDRTQSSDGFFYQITHRCQRQELENRIVKVYVGLIIYKTEEEGN